MARNPFTRRMSWRDSLPGSGGGNSPELASLYGLGDHEGGVLARQLLGCMCEACETLLDGSELSGLTDATRDQLSAAVIIQ